MKVISLCVTWIQLEIRVSKDIKIPLKRQKRFQITIQGITCWTSGSICMLTMCCHQSSPTRPKIQPAFLVLLGRKLLIIKKTGQKQEPIYENRQAAGWFQALQDWTDDQHCTRMHQARFITHLTWTQVMGFTWQSWATVDVWQFQRTTAVRLLESMI